MPTLELLKYEPLNKLLKWNDQFLMYLTPIFDPDPCVAGFIDHYWTLDGTGMDSGGGNSFESIPWSSFVNDSPNGDSSIYCFIDNSTASYTTDVSIQTTEGDSWSFFFWYKCPELTAADKDKEFFIMKDPSIFDQIKFYAEEENGDPNDIRPSLYVLNSGFNVYIDPSSWDTWHQMGIVMAPPYAYTYIDGIIYNAGFSGATKGWTITLGGTNTGMQIANIAFYNTNLASGTPPFEIDSSLVYHQYEYEKT